MSNCDFMAGKSLIDLAASRLALRAPALRAATALTRPNQSTQRLPRGRHAVPTAMTVGPKHVIANDRVERGDHLAHHCHDRDFRLLATVKFVATAWSRHIPVNKRALVPVVRPQGGGTQPFKPTTKMRELGRDHGGLRHATSRHRQADH